MNKPSSLTRDLDYKKSQLYQKIHQNPNTHIQNFHKRSTLIWRVPPPNSEPDLLWNSIQALFSWKHAPVHSTVSFDDEAEPTNAGSKSTGLLREFKSGHATCRGNKGRTSRGWKGSFVEQMACANRRDKIVKNARQKEEHEGDGTIFGVEGTRTEKSALGFKWRSSFKHLLSGLVWWLLDALSLNLYGLNYIRF